MPRVRVALVLLSIVVGCGSGRDSVRPTSPFLPIHARFFDDAVDFVREPISLGGAWASQWDEELRGRAGYADVILRVTVETLRTSIDLEHQRTYHIVCRREELLHGEAPPDERLEVSVSEGAGGFEVIARNERRLVNGSYVLFLKWFDAGSEVKSHWHLSPATRRLLSDVRRMLAEAGTRSKGQ